MRRGMKLTWCCLALLVLAVFFVPTDAVAQAANRITTANEADSRLLPRVLAVYFAVPADGFPPTVRFLAYESLVQELRALLPDVVILEPARNNVDLVEPQFPATPSTDPERSRMSRDMGADAYLSVDLSGDVPSVNVSFEFVDLLAGDRSASGSYTKRVDPRFRNMNALFWIPVSDAMKDKLKPREQLVDVTFEGRQGTTIEQEGGSRREVKLAAGGSQTGSADGGATATASVRLSAPGAYRFRASLPGYYPAVTGITVDQDPLRVPFRLQKKMPWMFDLTLTDLSFPAFSAVYQILPETLFVRATFETYLVSLIPLGSTGSDYDRNGSNRPFVLSLGSSSLTLSVGTYLLPQHGLWGTFRPYVSAGAFVRLVSMSGYWGIDPTIPWGAEAEVGLELFPESRLRAIIALCPRLYVAPDTALAASNIYDTKQFWRFKFFDGFILQIPIMYFGVRVQP